MILTPQWRTTNKSRRDKNKALSVRLRLKNWQIKISMLLTQNTKMTVNNILVILCSIFRFTEISVNSSIVSLALFICNIMVLIGSLSRHSYTGSAIRNWHKVKTWLDQMFWQIYQQLMLSGFLSSGNLCLIHYLKLFWPHGVSKASVRKGAMY